MTSTEKMLACLGLALLTLLVGCARGPELTPPTVLRSPYDASRGDVLFAVAPLRNESGTTVFRPEEVSDAIANALTSVPGIRCLPLNRTISEMRGLGMREISSPSDLEALAEAMNVDGLIVGTVTAYDPYNPPTLGISLALHAGNPVFAAGPELDEIRGAVRDPQMPAPSRYVDSPVASISEVFDGKNHAIQIEVRRYAQGRIDPTAARGWQTYLASMPLYTEFVAHAAVGRLLDQERLRLARARGPGSSR
ncbi:MAG: hypothetical protein KDA31_12810 [Phycisphaerales bacterium]|nr:hypothetical protein [Phycisphaerales bacterium]MCB9836667.1 hypothetical protein [Phycisphaera sp.]